MLTIRPILEIKPKWKDQYYNVLNITFVHQWDIENDKSRKNREETYLGPFSTSTHRFKLVWELIYKHGREKRKESTITLKLLNCEISDEIIISVHCELGVPDDMKNYICRRWTQRDSSEKKILKNRRKILDHSDAALNLKLRIYTFFKDKLICNHKVLDDMSTLIKTGYKGDIVFVIGNEEIKAHESILKVRNATFAKMFDNEKAAKRFEIEEMDATVFKELLHYIYTEREPTIEKEKIIKDLILAAEKYGVEDLKAWCSQEIVKTINNDNMTDILILADLVNSEFIKDKVVKFVLENNIKINEVNGYENMRASYFHLVEEMHVKITDRQAEEISKLVLLNK